MKKMRALPVAGLVMSLCNATPSFAQTAGSALSKDELQQILPGATVISVGFQGNSRRWTNDPGGKFIATSDVQGRGRSSMANGDWHVSDDGQYCVHVDWNRVTENWCAPVTKTTDGKYTLVPGSNSHAPTQIEIVR